MRSSPSGPPDWLTARPYAHRGLHGQAGPENSRAAFEAAIAAGFGIELDVQVTRDGQAIVFHDYELSRLTGAAGRVDAMDAADLRRIALSNGEPIPALDDVLALVAGRAPLLIEVKSPHIEEAAFCRAIAASLGGYSGPVALMSFNPRVVARFAALAPRIPRGLVVTEQDKKNWRGTLSRRFALWLSRAHFLAYDVRDLASPFVARARAKGLPVLTWTVRTPENEEAAARYADQIIHELPARNA